jgi:hypothetical protein
MRGIIFSVFTAGLNKILLLITAAQNLKVVRLFLQIVLQPVVVVIRLKEVKIGYHG